jgi:hypothetical protein
VKLGSCKTHDFFLFVQNFGLSPIVFLEKKRLNGVYRNKGASDIVVDY